RPEGDRWHTGPSDAVEGEDGDRVGCVVRETEGDDTEVRVDVAELGQDRRGDRLPIPGRHGDVRLARRELAERDSHRGAHVVQRPEAVLAVRVLVGPGHYLGVE